MADSINISTNEVVTTARKISAINEKLDDSLAEINKSMNDLSASWKSDGAEDIRAAMNALKPKFVEYKNVIDSYAKFLMEVAQRYENTESVVENNANQFK